MSDIPSMPYRDLWNERVITSVANLTRRDGEEFLKMAPAESQAEDLAAFLRSETDYEIYVRRQGRVGKREWFVAGATQPAPMTQWTINAWTEWMIAAGAANGQCAFQGWEPQGQPSGAA